MVSAGTFGTLLEYPGSPIHQSIADPLVRRMLMGVAMGLTSIALVYSPWGKQSGAHFNPAVTLTFTRLGKVDPVDATFYMLAQFVGGTLGVVMVAAALGACFTDAPVAFVVTRPGALGHSAAFVGEVAITCLLMSVILRVSRDARFAKFTGLCAGTLVALYITFEAPISGMSMNPARSFASAAPGGLWSGLWIYFLAPPLGMLTAAQIHLRISGPASVSCAKLHHQNSKRCIFCLWQHGPAEVVPPTKTVLKAVSGVIV